ncbi:MAG: TVP38/TMEM64 family protein [Chloroflexi bacterium]|nr:TVP38/TMEM64 family protein [Chloroflexota bacterium]
MTSTEQGQTATSPEQDDQAPYLTGRRAWYDFGITFTPRQALLLLALLAIGVAVSYALDFAVSRFVGLEAEDVKDWVSGFGALAPVVYIALLASTIIFSPLPSVPVDIAGGLAFGWAPATVYTVIGGMIGATVNFYLARWLGRGFVERKIGRQAMTQIDTLAERTGFKFVFALRLLPLFNFDWVSYAAGLTLISFRTYAVASVLGMLPPVVGITYVGDVLLSHPGRSALVFTSLVAWSALPPMAFLLWTGVRALHRRGRRTSPLPEAERTPTPGADR